MLATKLNMTPDEAEKWIVNLIRNVRLDARIDAKQVTIDYTVSAVMCYLYCAGSCGHEYTTSVHISTCH